MRQFLNLIRWPNLLIIAISMCFTLFFVINPLLGLQGFEAGINALGFLLLILSTLLIAVGGYLINDYFDMDIDRINKPGKNQVGMRFPVSTVQLSYWIVNVVAVIMGFVVAWMSGKVLYGLVFVFTAGLLRFYSERYQCMPLIGNLVIAFLSALSFGLVWFFDFFSMMNDPVVFATVQASFPLVNKVLLIYLGFAFLTGLLRELVKDIEDIEGDTRYGCNTFPVQYGTTNTKRFGIAVALTGLLLSVWAQTFFLQAGFMWLSAFFILIDLGFLLIAFLFIRAKEKSKYSRLSVIIKILMLAGIFSMILIYFEV